MLMELEPEYKFVAQSQRPRKSQVEITLSDGSELISSREEVFVQITSDTYEKVDAATTLIEMLLSSVSVKSAASVSGDHAQASIGGQETTTTQKISTAMANQELQSDAAPISTSSQGHLPAIPKLMVAAFPFNPSFDDHYLDLVLLLPWI